MLRQMVGDNTDYENNYYNWENVDTLLLHPDNIDNTQQKEEDIAREKIKEEADTLSRIKVTAQSLTTEKHNTILNTIEMIKALFKTTFLGTNYEVLRNFLNKNKYFQSFCKQNFEDASNKYIKLYKGMQDEINQYALNYKGEINEEKIREYVCNIIQKWNGVEKLNQVKQNNILSAYDTEKFKIIFDNILNNINNELIETYKPEGQYYNINAVDY